MDYCLFLSTVEFDPVSAIIRARTNCAWSHTGFYRLADKWTFSAMANGGVAWRPPDPRAKILVLAVDNVEDALTKAETQAGDGYDFLDILGIALGENWEAEGRMICDKLVFWAFKEIGYPLLNHTFIPMEHLTPRDVLLSASVKEYVGT